MVDAKKIDRKRKKTEIKTLLHISLWVELQYPAYNLLETSKDLQANHENLQVYVKQ